ncbi:MAG: Glyceraldehyde-3-phosphate dehydrogenase [Methanomassiliicoccales archaeon PtaB.Bin215]|nr:MAG: Glyceraldehyde-3-phosphate dehydrogenase [Methanomassiliicoccales archaeon PtaB.Bin215]
MKVKVGINGYGTIGKRVAWAVNRQDDMEVVGVTKTRPSYEASTALREGCPLYAAHAEDVDNFEKAGIKVHGTLDDLLKKVDVIVDCTPGGTGAKNKELYVKAGVKSIFQGGEDHDMAGISFNALANYQEAWGASSVRVVSCNTTGLVRTLFPLQQAFGIQKVFASLIRRGADPADKKGAALNAIEPSLKLPTHHGPDVKTVMHGLEIQTMAVVTPTTLMHLHCIVVDLKKEVTEKEVLEVWSRSPRLQLVSGKDGIKNTGQIMELAKDLHRVRGDLMDIAVWKDGIKTVGSTLYYYQAVHQESDVVPENVDCIRAMMKLEKDNLASIAKTNKSIGL